MRNGNLRVIIDTNVWISFLIGKRLSPIKAYLSDGRITLITTRQLLLEIQQVTARPKLKRYFPADRVHTLLQLLKTISEEIEIKSEQMLCRDPKDNFLLDLIVQSQAHVLVTGDKDLLLHNPFKTTLILTPQDFEKQLEKLIKTHCT